MASEHVDPPLTSVEDILDRKPKQSTYRTVVNNPYLFGVAVVSTLSFSSGSSSLAIAANQLHQFSSLGGLLFGYDQGVVSGILTMESFGVAFPRIYLDSGFKGWFVSTLLLRKAAILGDIRRSDSGSCLAWFSSKWTDCGSLWSQEVHHWSGSGVLARFCYPSGCEKCRYDLRWSVGCVSSRRFMANYGQDEPSLVLPSVY